MAYKSISDLPSSIRENLPPEGQQNYLEAYNKVWESYTPPKEHHKTDPTREETAHRQAWAAVKKMYKKESDKWVKKEH